MIRHFASHARAKSAIATLALFPALLANPMIASSPLAQSRATTSTDSIPLPEQPRPDFARPDWQNLNGRWDFAFDAQNSGETSRWFAAPLPSPRSILVPYSWGSALSGVADALSYAMRVIFFDMRFSINS